MAEYVFKHPLTQGGGATARSSRSGARRCTRPWRAAIEAAHADKLDEQAALLAHHWEAGGRESPQRAGTAAPRSGRATSRLHPGTRSLAEAARAPRRRGTSGNRPKPRARCCRLRPDDVARVKVGMPETRGRTAACRGQDAGRA